MNLSQSCKLKVLEEENVPPNLLLGAAMLAGAVLKEVAAKKSGKPCSLPSSVQGEWLFSTWPGRTSS